MFKHQQIFSQDPAKFSHRERQLRDYHLRNWLKMNRSNQELLELSLNYFYGEQPKLLGWSLNIIDRDPRGLVVAAIMRESGANAAQAELLFEQLQSRIVQCRALVEEVTRNSRFSSGESKRMLQERVARAGVIRHSTIASSQIVIVNRPTLVTAGAALLLMSAAMTILFILVEFPGMGKFHQLVGPKVGITLSIFFSVSCAWGYWNMKRWAVLLCVIELLMRLFLDMPHSVIAMPLLIAAFGIMHWSEMSWK
ncbi:MAG: hypothetical protein ACRD4B_04520 [Acidobacteriota bacterium]